MERLREPFAADWPEAIGLRLSNTRCVLMHRQRTAAQGTRSRLLAWTPWLGALMMLAACSPIRVTEPVETESAPTTAPTTESSTALTSAVTAPPRTTAATIQAPTTSAVTTEPAPPTIPAPLYRAPLTGLPAPAEITRPAAVVKIDNHPNALPQWGINMADVVYEELVEARLTRLVAIFHSRDAHLIGPIRSARTGDFALLSNLNRPIFVNSGANEYTERALRGVDAVNITDGGSLDNGVFKRSPAKQSPHNLISDTTRIFAAGSERGGTPPAYFRFRDEGESLPRATTVSGVDIDFGQIEASYRWNAGLGGWTRTQNGSEHTDFDGVRVAPENVIVQFVRYRQSPANRVTPEPVLTGSGVAWMLSDGQVVQGTWERLSERDVTVFRSDNSVIVPLTPGRTWIALARKGTATLVP
ncbi:DUF3048 domain-containing protein [Candidatus Poriferisodalis sp.]|uniref:DUF3048 domain-containing protein n=1 Tax=Candidatus Poriferisodalis sp. TaxID=3101277 RepID=UPI003B01575A